MQVLTKALLPTEQCVPKVVPRFLFSYFHANRILLHLFQFTININNYFNFIRRKKKYLSSQILT